MRLRLYQSDAKGKMLRPKYKNCPRSKAPHLICENWWWGCYSLGMYGCHRYWLPCFH
uniref:Uncharacterized protein n=1 Tax=Anguilla anguilla TaxID=7936 RepID=A0A0E9X0F3_ANGAN